MVVKYLKRLYSMFSPIYIGSLLSCSLILNISL